MDSILQARAARSMKLVAVWLEWRRELAKQILELQLTCSESSAVTAIEQIYSEYILQ